MSDNRPTCALVFRSLVVVAMRLANASAVSPLMVAFGSSQSVGIPQLLEASYANNYSHRMTRWSLSSFSLTLVVVIQFYLQSFCMSTLTQTTCSSASARHALNIPINIFAGGSLQRAIRWHAPLNCLSFTSNGGKSHLSALKALSYLWLLQAALTLPLFHCWQLISQWASQTSDRCVEWLEREWDGTRHQSWCRTHP